MTWTNTKKPAPAVGARETLEFSHVRVRAIFERPYFALALSALVPVPTPMLGTFGVDKWGRLYYDPQVLDEWGAEQSANVLYHELGHWLRDHHSRFEQLVKTAECTACAAQIANFSQDAEINDDLIAENLKLPGDCITPQNLGMEPHLLAEEYYAELMKRKPPPSKGGSGKQDGGGGQGAQGGGSGADDQQPDQSGQQPPPGSSGGGKLCDRHKPIVITVKAPNCGSGAHGIPQPWEQPGPSGNGDNDPTPGIGQAEADLIRRQVASEIQQAAQKGIGKLPAGWVRWAQRILRPPQIPWERELAALVRNAMSMAAGCVDYSYDRPARRGLWNGVIMPSLRRPKPEAVVVIDTSGSMSEPDLAATLAETQGILKACGQRSVQVIACDAAAAPAQRVCNAMNIQLIGGGGTDMGVGIDAAQKLHADVIICLTDGGTGWGPAPPRGSQLVIGIIGDGFENCPTPSYAKRVVKIKVNQKAA